jgi:hypothetical protein
MFLEAYQIHLEAFPTLLEQEVTQPSGTIKGRKSMAIFQKPNPNDKMNFTCSLSTPLAFIRAQDSIILTTAALEDGAQFQKGHKARDNEGLPNRLATERFLRNQTTRIETNALMGSSELSFEDTQNQLNSIFHQISAVKTLQKKIELKRMTFLAFNPPSYMSMTRKDEVARQILAFTKPSEFEELKSLQSFPIDLIETPKPLGHLSIITRVSYAIRCKRQAQNEVAEKDAAVAFAVGTKIDDSSQDSFEKILPDIATHLTYSIQSGRQEQWGQDLENDAEEVLAAATRIDESLRYSLTFHDDAAKDPGNEPVMNKVKGMQWSFNKVREPIFLIHRL